MDYQQTQAQENIRINQGDQTVGVQAAQDCPKWSRDGRSPTGTK